MAGYWYIGVVAPQVAEMLVLPCKADGVGGAVLEGAAELPFLIMRCGHMSVEIGPPAKRLGVLAARHGAAKGIVMNVLSMSCELPLSLESCSRSTAWFVAFEVGGCHW